MASLALQQTNEQQRPNISMTTISTERRYDAFVQHMLSFLSYGL